MESQAKEIEKLVEQLNDCWRKDRLENMDMFFHKRVVMLSPGTNDRIAGREEMIDSYREFVESAEVSDFRIKNQYIDVFETTAVVYYTFRIQYRVESTNYDEIGSEILVFYLHNEHWQVVWRTQMPG